MTGKLLYLDTVNKGVGATGGTGGENVEARVGKLETHIEYIKNDLSDIKTEIKDLNKKLSSHLPIWFIGMFIATVGVVSGLIYFVHTSNQQFMSILVNAVK